MTTRTRTTSTGWDQTDPVDELNPLDATLDDLDEEAETVDNLDDGILDDGILDDPLNLLTRDDDPDTLDLGSVHDERTFDDFDFTTLVANLPLYDMSRCIDALEAEKLPYLRACREAGRKAGIADFHNAVNVGLFHRRRDLIAQIDKLNNRKRHTDASTSELTRARASLEVVNELIFRFNYGLTRNYVRKFTSNTSREDSADFQAAANFGLMTAIASFNPDLGKFGNWAYKRIQREVLKAVQAADFPTLTSGEFERRPAILKAYEKLSGPNGEHTPTPEELAEETGFRPAVIEHVLHATRIDSLHVHVGDDGDTELGDLIADDSRSVEDTVVASLGTATLLQYGLPLLDPRERYVLSCRFGLHGEPEEALADIGKHLGRSREGVRQIAGKALAKLLHPMVLGRILRDGRVEGPTAGHTR